MANSLGANSCSHGTRRTAFPFALSTQDSVASEGKKSSVFFCFFFSLGPEVLHLSKLQGLFFSIADGFSLPGIVTFEGDHPI